MTGPALLNRKIHRLICCMAALAGTLSVPTVSPAAPEIGNVAMSDDAPGVDWPGYGRTFNQQRFSPLNSINVGNVNRLGLVSSVDIDAANVSTVPLESGGVIYFAVGNSVVYAVSAVNSRILWKYDPKVTGYKLRFAWGIRGLALWKDKVYVGAQDGRLIALAAANGKLVWQTQTTQPGDVRYITGAPLVYSGKVLIGHGGADYGATRGYVTAYDAESGRQLWRFFTVPGDPSQRFENKAMEMAAKTWTGEWWKYGGGGTVWNAMTYDPQLNLVYLGTGNGAPWNVKIRSPDGGDNLFLCSIVALDADTGEYRWHYQTNPRESWDFNSDMDMILATMPIAGVQRKVLLHAPKNGFFYVIDRETGKLISAEKYAKATWADHIDIASGRPVEVPNARYENGQQLMWPGPLGAHAWQPMSFNPETGLVYVPGRDIAGSYDDRGIDPRTWRFTADGDTMGVHLSNSDVPKDAGKAWLLAWDPVKQKEAWRISTPGMTPGGTITTRGGLVFQPDPAGHFVAFDAASGEKLWSFDMGVGSQGAPLTYSVGAIQYVSIISGFGGQPMMLGSASAQFGWVGRSYPRRLLTFALGGHAKLPKSPPPAQPSPLEGPDLRLGFDPDKIEKGRQLFLNCSLCHGLAAIAGGYAPDLRASSVPLSAPAFATIVKGGALESRGMPKFDELSDEQLDELRQYIRNQAKQSLEAAGSTSRAGAGLP